MRGTPSDAWQWTEAGSIKKLFGERFEEGDARQLFPG